MFDASKGFTFGWHSGINYKVKWVKVVAFDGGQVACRTDNNNVGKPSKSFQKPRESLPEAFLISKDPLCPLNKYRQQ